MGPFCGRTAPGERSTCRAPACPSGIRKSPSGSGGTGATLPTPRTASASTPPPRTAGTGRQPDLGLYEWNGSTANNIAYRSPDRSLYHVIRDEGDEDPRRRYKAFFSDMDHMNRCPGVSPDGFRWTFPDVPPIPSQDTSQLIHDDLGQRYLATVKHRTEWGRSAWLATSPDFVHWTDPVLILHTDEIDQENRGHRIQEVVDDPAFLSPPVVDGREYIAQLYMLPVMTYEGLYIGFPLLFNPSGTDPEQTNHTGLNQVELAVSRDARHWHRVADRAVFLGVEPWEGGANFGNAQVALCGPPIVRGQEIWIYYNAYRFRGHRNLFAGLDPAIYNDAFWEESGPSVWPDCGWTASSPSTPLRRESCSPRLSRGAARDCT